MADKKIIEEMLSEVLERRRILELSAEEIKIGLDSQVEIIKKWIKSPSTKDKAQLFTKRIPLGTIIPQHKKLNSCKFINTIRR